MLTENRSGRIDSYKIMSSNAGNTAKALEDRKWRSGVSVVFGLLCGTLLLGNERIKRISKNMSSFCLLIFRKSHSHSKGNSVYLLLQKDEHLHKSPTKRVESWSQPQQEEGGPFMPLKCTRVLKSTNTLGPLHHSMFFSVF